MNGQNRWIPCTALAALITIFNLAQPAAAQASKQDEGTNQAPDSEQPPPSTEAPQTTYDDLDSLFGPDPDAAIERSDRDAATASSNQLPSSAAENQDEPNSENPAAGHSDQNGTPIQIIPVGPPPEAAQATQAPPRRRAIEEIIVTATKREADLREIPASVAAITGDQIENRGIANLSDIVSETPGVNLVDEKNCVGCAPTVTIRGISGAPNTVGTAGLFFNEIALNEPFLPVGVADISPFDLKAVEILKGPVGTLFGGSALNGAIRYIPRPPEFDEWEVKGYSELRAHDESDGLGKDLGLVVNAPFHDRVALRILATHSSFPGQIDSTNPAVQRKDVDDSQRDTFRATLRTQPLDELDISATYISQRAQQGDFGLTQGPSQRFERWGDPTESYFNTRIEMWELKASYFLSFADLTFVAGGADKLVDAYFDLSHVASGPTPETSSTEPLLTSLLNGVGKPGSEELRLVSTGAGHWDWLVGLYNFHYDIDLDVETSSGDNPAGAALWNAVDSLGINQNLASSGGGIESISVRGAGEVFERAMFGNVNWRFLEDFEATLGARIYRFSYDTAYSSSCATSTSSCDPTTQSGEQRVVGTESGVSPKLGFKWQISPDIMSYASVAKGFRFGGVNSVGRADVPATYKSDTLWSAELGFRTSWLDESLVADATVFALRWKDAQFTQITSDGTAGYTDNAGRVKGLGLESQLIWATPLAGLAINVNGTYSDIRTDGAFTGGDGSEVEDGTRWPRAPLLQYGATAAWNGTVGEKQLGLSLSYNYQGPALQGFKPADRGVVIFDYATLGLNVTLRLPNRTWMPDFALNANNLTNVREDTLFKPGVSEESDLHSFNAPRNVSLRLTWHL